MSKKQARALIAAASAALLGVVLVAILHVVGITESATIIALLLIPILVFGVASDSLRELTGPGGWGAKFDRLEAQMEAQQKLINDLVIFSMSASVFRHLCGIALLREYNYKNSASEQREYYFLRDNGFIRPRGTDGFLEFDEKTPRNVSAIAEPTEAGWLLVRLRKGELPVDWTKDAVNFRSELAASLT